MRKTKTTLSVKIVITLGLNVSKENDRQIDQQMATEGGQVSRKQLEAILLIAWLYRTLIVERHNS